MHPPRRSPCVTCVLLVLALVALISVLLFGESSVSAVFLCAPIPHNIAERYSDLMAYPLRTPDLAVEAIVVKEGHGEATADDVSVGLPRPFSLLLCNRSRPPYRLAIPGGFVEYGEAPERAFARELREETLLDVVAMLTDILSAGIQDGGGEAAQPSAGGAVVSARSSPRVAAAGGNAPLVRKGAAAAAVKIAVDSILSSMSRRPAQLALLDATQRAFCGLPPETDSSVLRSLHSLAAEANIGAQDGGAAAVGAPIEALSLALDANLRVGLLGVYGDPERDRRRHTVSSAYLVYIPQGSRFSSAVPQAHDDVKDCRFHDLGKLLKRRSAAAPSEASGVVRPPSPEGAGGGQEAATPPSSSSLFAFDHAMIAANVGELLKTTDRACRGHKRST